MQISGRVKGLHLFSFWFRTLHKTVYRRAINSKELFGRVITATSLQCEQPSPSEGKTAPINLSVTDVGKADPEVMPVRKKMLGEREPPRKKERERKKNIPEPEEETKEVEERRGRGWSCSWQPARPEIPNKPNWRRTEKKKKLNPSSGSSWMSDGSGCPRIKKSTYFTKEKNLVITITHI